MALFWRQQVRGKRLGDAKEPRQVALNKIATVCLHLLSLASDLRQLSEAKLVLPALARLGSKFDGNKMDGRRTNAGVVL
jgi:hypothetical protein